MLLCSVTISIQTRYLIPPIIVQVSAQPYTLMLTNGIMGRILVNQTGSRLVTGVAGRQQVPYFAERNILKDPPKFGSERSGVGPEFPGPARP